MVKFEPLTAALATLDARVEERRGRQHGVEAASDSAVPVRFSPNQ
jgi:hypothetical protein